MVRNAFHGGGNVNFVNPIKFTLPFPYNMYSSSFTSQLLVSAPCSLKRKAISPLTDNVACSICLHEDAVLQTKECGHFFHTRCVASWPMVNCPTCTAPVSSVSIVNVNLDEKPAVRSGKWGREEEKYMAAVLAIHEDDAFPLANGTPLRTFLARLLNCSPMRVSKKFQKNPLGKRTYEPSAGNRFSFSAKEHSIKMRHLSTLESEFRASIIWKRNHDISNRKAEVRDLSIAARQFWVKTFLTFAVLNGQSVDGIDFSGSKGKKQTLRRIRAGHYNQLFTVDQGASKSRKPINMPPALKNPMTMEHLNPWRASDFIPARSWKQQNTKHLSIASLLAPTPVGSKMIVKKGSFDDAIDLLGLEESTNDAQTWAQVASDDLPHLIKYNPSHSNDWYTLV